MFDNIVLERSIGRQPLTAGELAEALLFYKRVHIVFNETNLAKLARSVGPSTLLRILHRPNVSAVYCKNGVVVTMTNTVGGDQYHDCCSISAINRGVPEEITDRTELLEVLLERSGSATGFTAKRYARELRKIVPFRSYAGNDFVDGGIFEAARQDVLDSAYVYEAVRRILQAFVPAAGSLPRFRFDAIKMDDGFVVDSDLDFARLNELVSEKDRGLLKINPGFLLDVIFTTRVSLTLAAHYGSELHTWELLSNLMQLRCTNLLQKVRPELAKAASFQEVAFPEGRMIKEAIDSGERQFEDFVPILDRSEQFREWTHGPSADANLVHEYFAAVTADKWISSMPVKALRYVFGVQAQLADTVLAGMPGLVLSAVDALLLDRLLRGWKPNHFVDKDLKPFWGSA